MGFKFFNPQLELNSQVLYAKTRTRPTIHFGPARWATGWAGLVR